MENQEPVNLEQPVVSSSKNIIFIVVGIIVLLIIGGGIYFYLNSKSEIKNLKSIDLNPKVEINDHIVSIQETGEVPVPLLLDNKKNMNNQFFIYISAFKNYIDLLKSQNTLNFRDNLNMSVNQKGFSEERRLKSLAEYDAKTEVQKKEEMSTSLAFLPKSSGNKENYFFSEDEVVTLEHKIAKSGQEYDQLTVSGKDGEASVVQKLSFGLDLNNKPFFLGANEAVYSLSVSEADKKAILDSLNKISYIIDNGNIDDFKNYIKESYQGEENEELPDKALLSIRDLYKEDISKLKVISNSTDKIKWESNGKTINLTFVDVDESKKVVLEIPPLDLPFPDASNVKNESQKFYGGTYNRTVEFIKKNNEWYLRSSLF